MARGVLAAAALVAALGAVGSASAGRSPILRAATVSHRHVVLKLSVGDLRPMELAVATRRGVGAGGALLRKNVRLRETIQLSPTARGVVVWMSPRALGPGVWLLQVRAVETGGVTDCPPKLRNCNDRWSSVRRVVVRS